MNLVIYFKLRSIWININCNNENQRIIGIFQIKDCKNGTHISHTLFIESTNGGDIVYCIHTLFIDPNAELSVRKCLMNKKRWTNY